MDDRKKTKAQLLQELTTLRRRVAFQAGALSRRQAWLTSILDINKRIAASEDMPSLLGRIAEGAVQLVGADGARVRLRQGDRLVVLAAADCGAVIPWTADLGLWEGMAGQIVRQNHAIVVPDIQANPAILPAYKISAAQQGVSSLVSVPITGRRAVLGVLNVMSKRPRVFTDDEVVALSACAEQAAITIEQARLVEEVQQQMTGLGQAHAQLQSLSQQLVETQEAERRSVARELHDDIGQALTALKINLQALDLGPGAGLAPRLADSIDIVDDTLHRVRELALALRPALLDDLGLVPALRWYVDHQAQRAQFTVRFAAGSLPQRLPRTIETACFRIVQEALTNIMRHAQARQVQITLHQRDADLHLMICDDGIGFDVAAAQQQAVHGKSMGLLNMRERVLLARGQFEITSVPQRGTVIWVRFPL